MMECSGPMYVTQDVETLSCTSAINDTLIQKNPYCNKTDIQTLYRQ